MAITHHPTLSDPTSTSLYGLSPTCSSWPVGGRPPAQAAGSCCASPGAQSQVERRAAAARCPICCEVA
jgi:hypothetical protein